MIGYASIGTVLLAALIHATLQLSPGSLLLLYHESLKKHVRVKTRRLASRYVFGVMLMTLLALSTICFVISVVFSGAMNLVGMLICVGALVGLAFCAWFLYYRSGRSTELWLPKSVARFIARRAKVTESNVEAFSLGMLVGFAEMPFTLVLMVVAANGILALPQVWQIVALALYTIVAIMPLVVLCIGIRRGQTVVDVQRWRNRNKAFFRILSGIGFLALAGFLVAFEIVGRGR